jgi:hypothetical protein
MKAISASHCGYKNPNAYLSTFMAITEKLSYGVSSDRNLDFIDLRLIK